MYSNIYENIVIDCFNSMLNVPSWKWDVPRKIFVDLLSLVKLRYDCRIMPFINEKMNKDIANIIIVKRFGFSSNIGYAWHQVIVYNRVWLRIKRKGREKNGKKY